MVGVLNNDRRLGSSTQSIVGLCFAEFDVLEVAAVLASVERYLAYGMQAA